MKKFIFFGYEFQIKKKRKRLQKTPDGRPKLELDIEKIKEMKKQGFSNVDIAKIFNVSEGTIRNRLKAK
jgi:DNA invertase Pin-like site-specific DNA recombinase